MGTIKIKELTTEEAKFLPDGIERMVRVKCGNEEIGVITTYEYLNLPNASMSVKEQRQNVNSYEEGFEWIKKNWEKFISEVAETM